MTTRALLSKTIHLLILFLFLSISVYSQPRLLGEVHFPNSGSDEAQDAFIEGLLFLHNFEYRDAATAFQKAQQIDPQFTMAYWGEAMTKNQPIWFRQQRDEAIQVLKKLAPTPEERRELTATNRERQYLHTIEILFGTIPETRDLSKIERDLRYRNSLKNLHGAYPEDDEARSFYGLSILGSSHDGRDFRLYMQAAATLMPVWERNKKHPGAAHYLIHSFDDPIHAPLGLPMAEAYSKIAPDAAHAQHMVSHIFLALGMWGDVVSANETASAVEIAREKELGETTTVCGHNLYWLVYGYTQQSRNSDSSDIINTCYARVQTDQTNSNLWHFAMMRARHIIDTGEWSKTDQWTLKYDIDSSGSDGYYFTNAYSDIKKGQIADANTQLEKLEKVFENEPEPELEIMILQLSGLLDFSNNMSEKGLDKLKKAAQMENDLPLTYGPPAILKPSFELLGEQLLKLDKPEEAADAFQKQLDLTPKRVNSIEGLSNANEYLAEN